MRLQSGAILAKRGPGLDAFVNAWLRRYASLYSEEIDATQDLNRAKVALGADQRPLKDLVQRRCRGGKRAAAPSPDLAWVVGALPAAGR